MSDNSAAQWRVTFDSTKTAEQKKTEIAKIKADGAKYWADNCGRKKTSEDDVFAMPSEGNPAMKESKGPKFCKQMYRKLKALIKKIKSSDKYKKATKAQRAAFWKKFGAKVLRKSTPWGCHKNGKGSKIQQKWAKVHAVARKFANMKN
jgi:hypothetical protein